ncbi:hypothetical protein [Halosimplex salinum]|uniref:hypothetical protein n=1 Tax=Halosimplex salinum TaxID=1710538 RepID=UPI000F46957D|nr:hypothetical protein [Halosimplex salinum]
MSYEEMEEITRDELLAASEQLERMSLTQFEELFSPFFEKENYNSDADAFEIALGLDRDYGIEAVRYTHLRAYDNNRNPIQDGHKGEFEIERVSTGSWDLRDVDDPSQSLGMNMLNLVHPVREPLASERLMQGIYEALLTLMTSSSPSTYFINPTLDVELYQHEDQDIDVTEVHGDPWKVPDLEPDEDKQIQRMVEGDLVDVIGEINAANPMSGLTCSHFFDECEHVGELPEGSTHPEERELIEKRQRQHRLDPGTAVRAVAVVTRNQYKGEQEEWEFEDLWYEDCGPSIEEFESEYASRKSIGKDEVLIDGRIELGDLQDTEFGEYHEMHVTDIDILARKGEYANEE